MKRIYKKGILFLFIVAAIVLLYHFGFAKYVSLEKLKEHNLVLKTFVDNYYFFSVALYLSTLFLSIIIGLPLVPLFALAAGYLFGIFWGVTYSLLAIILGAVAAFLLYRYFFYGIIHSKYHVKLEKIENEVKTNGASYLLMLQFLSVVPFFIITTIAVLADISLFTVFWTTLFGSFPFTLVYVIAGSQLSTINSLGDLMSTRMIIILGLFVVLALIPVVIKRIKKNHSSLPYE